MKPKVSIDNVVLVRITRAENGPSLGGDEGLATRLLQWTIKNDIFSVRGFGTTGPDRFSAMYEPEDADRVRKWLSEQPETR